MQKDVDRLRYRHSLGSCTSAPNDLPLGSGHPQAPTVSIGTIATILTVMEETAAKPSAEPGKRKHVSRPLPDDRGLDHAPLVRITAPRGAWASLRLRELWEFRGLLYFFVWRDIKVRYKQTILGGLWAIIQPLFTMFVFTIFFHRLGGVPSDGLPYPVFSFAALVPWQFFQTGVTHGSESVVMNARLVTKVYFPRMAIPASAVLAGLVDLAIAMGVLLIIMAYYGIAPPIQCNIPATLPDPCRRDSIGRKSLACGTQC